MTENKRVHYRTCTLCEAMCGIEIKLDGDKIMSIRGDVEDPFSRGHICPKATALQDIHADPDRLRQPVRRTEAGWEPVEWETAFDEIAERLTSIQRTYGHDAVGVYQGNPTVHNLGSILFAPDLIRSLKTKNRFSATSVDQLPHQLVAQLMFGHQLLLPIPDLDRTMFWLIFGANPAVSNGSLMTAPDVKKRLKAIRQRGGRVVVVDPRRTETAELADQHCFVRPGSDVLVLLALLHTIFAEQLADPGRLAAFTDGLEAIEALVASFSPEQVAPLTGLAAPTIRQLAREFAAASSAVCYGRIGVSVQEFGSLCQWLINVLNIVTGNLDCPGGAMFTTPALDTLLMTGKGHFGRWSSRVRGLPETSSELPVVTLAEEILTAGPGQIKALITSAGNPVLSTPNGRQLETALATLDFMVAIDFYINETTSHADFILPPTSPLEHDHYDVIFHILAIRNTAKYSPALFEPAADARHDWEIFQALGSRMAARAGDPAGIAPAARQPIPPTALLERGLRAGPYHLELAQLREAPHGLDLGPLEPRLPERLFTPTKRIKLVPEILARELERVAATFLSQAPEPEAQLYLIGRRQLRSNNSWMHNSYRLVKGAQRCTLLINPADAARLGVAESELVRIHSRVGTIEAQLELTDTIMPGIVSLPHGWGHARPGVRLATAQKHPGVSLNDLTDEQAIDQLSGNAALNGLAVRIERLPR